MKKKIQVAGIILISALGLFFAYRLIFIRVVNYEIAGLKIPSKYNALTGSVKPIINYKGKKTLPPLRSSTTKNIGLSEEEAAIAQFRWAVFEEWANAKPQYKGWATDPIKFKKAMNAFKSQVGGFVSD